MTKWPNTRLAITWKTPLAPSPRVKNDQMAQYKTSYYLKDTPLAPSPRVKNDQMAQYKMVEGWRRGEPTKKPKQPRLKTN